MKKTISDLSATAKTVVKKTADVANISKATKTTSTPAVTRKRSRSLQVIKNRFLDALRDSLGVVSTACEAVGVSRSDYELYYREDESFRTAADATGELALDYVEEALLKLIEAGNVTATLFYLKTKGKTRGYTERGDSQNEDTKSTLTAVLGELRALYNREFANEEKEKNTDSKSSSGSASYTLRSADAVGQEYNKGKAEGNEASFHAAYSPLPAVASVESTQSSSHNEARHSIDKLFNLHENTYRR